MWTLRAVCINIDPSLIADQRNFKVKYLQNGEENLSKKYIKIMSYFIYADLISGLLDPRLVDPGSILINVGTYGP